LSEITKLIILECCVLKLVIKLQVLTLCFKLETKIEWCNIDCEDIFIE